MHLERQAHHSAKLGKPVFHMTHVSAQLELRCLDKPYGPDDLVKETYGISAATYSSPPPAPTAPPASTSPTPTPGTQSPTPWLRPRAHPPFLRAGVDRHFYVTSLRHWGAQLVDGLRRHLARGFGRLRAELYRDGGLRQGGQDAGVLDFTEMV